MTARDPYRRCVEYAIAELLDAPAGAGPGAAGLVRYAPEPLPDDRPGVCRPVRLFDPVRREPLDVRAHPLTAMDCTLSHPGCRSLDEGGAFDCCARLVRQTRRHGGEFVALWHNHMLEAELGGYHRRLYPRLLQELVAPP